MKPLSRREAVTTGAALAVAGLSAPALAEIGNGDDLEALERRYHLALETAQELNCRASEAFDRLPGWAQEEATIRCGDDSTGKPFFVRGEDGLDAIRLHLEGTVFLRAGGDPGIREAVDRFISDRRRDMAAQAERIDAERKRLGYAALAEKAERAVREARELGKRIAKTRAVTLKGIAVKLRLADQSDGAVDPDLVASALLDAERLGSAG